MTPPQPCVYHTLHSVRTLTPSDVTTVAFLDIMHAAVIASTLEWVASREEEQMPVLPLEVFISYAHQDRALKDELVKHQAPELASPPETDQTLA